MGANEKQIGGDHYAEPIQVWDFVVANNIPYLEGNAIKYISRWRKKGGLADIDKAIHYLQKLKEVELIQTSPITTVQGGTVGVTLPPLCGYKENTDASKEQSTGQTDEVSIPRSCFR